MVDFDTAKAGETFEWCGQKWICLDPDYVVGDSVGTLALLECFIEDDDGKALKVPFSEEGSCHWYDSSLRDWLIGWGDEHLKLVGLLPVRLDLTYDDGSDNPRTGTLTDHVFLLTAGMYRKYRKYIPNRWDWWWLSTPNCPSPSHTSIVRLVNASGALYGNYASYGHAVAPACVIHNSHKLPALAGKDAAVRVAKSTDSVSPNCDFRSLVDYALDDLKSDVLQSCVEMCVMRVAHIGVDEFVEKLQKIAKAFRDYEIEMSKALDYYLAEKTKEKR